MSQETSYEEQSQPDGEQLAQSPELVQDTVALPPTQDTTEPVQKSSGNKNLLVGIGIGIALTLVGTQLLASKQVDPPAEANEVASAQTPAKSVTITKVETDTVARTLEANGSVAAFELIPVLSQADGLQIKQVLVDEGEFVEAGQLVALLDDAVLQAQLMQAKADMAQAEARLAQLRAGSRREEIAQAKESVLSAQAAVREAQSYLDLAQKRVERNSSLEAQGAIARDRLDEVLNEQRTKQSQLQAAQARLREAQQRLAQLETGERPEVITQAEAELSRAKGQVQLVEARLQDTRVVTPVSGKIAQRTAKVGAITSSSQTLFTIIENGRLELLLKVPETDLAKINSGQTVEIYSQVNRDLRLTGKVREIDPVVEEASRQATVKVDLPANSTLKPGMFLKSQITTSSVAGLTVPAKAVLPQSDGSALVYKLTGEDTVTAQSVEMGNLLPQGKVEIKAGLSPGDRIVVKGAAYLRDGDRISVSNE